MMVDFATGKFSLYASKFLEVNFQFLLHLSTHTKYKVWVVMHKLYRLLDKVHVVFDKVQVSTGCDTRSTGCDAQSTGCDALPPRAQALLD